jgi:PAS domain S-box-containing protein
MALNSSAKHGRRLLAVPNPPAKLPARTGDRWSMAWLRIWSDLSLRTKGLVVAAFPAVATVVIAGASYLIESRTEAAARSADQAMRIIEASQILKSSETGTSANIRAYYITADDSFRVETGHDMAQFDRALARVAELVADSPGQTQQVLRVGTLHDARADEIARGMAQFRSARLSKEQLHDSTAMNETRRLEMVRILNGIETGERRLREVSRRQSARLSALLRVATLILGLAGVLGGVVISLLFAAGITGRIERLQGNVALLKAGRPLVPLPEGRDEIGALSEGLATAAEMLAHRSAALENALHGIAEADASGHYHSFNKAFGELLELGGNSALASIQESVHPDDWWKVAGALERMRLQGRAETEVRMVRAGGSSVNVGVTFLPVSESQSSGCYVFLRDITRQKEVESALVQAKNAAVAASRAKLEFLAKISHDIRTPLNAILGAADLLAHTTLNAEQSEYVGLFQRNCRRLVSLINDFLDFSKIEAGMVKVDKVPFRVRETAEEAVATFRDTAFRKGVQIYASVAPGVPEWVLGDPARVQQVLVNLLSNALKFTEAGHVGLDVRAEDGKLRFEVSDTGSGVRLEDQERIFAAFTQLPNQTTGGAPGSGLGLTICKELLDLMGGKIGVTSEPGRGSRFHFELPLQAVENMPAGYLRAVEAPAVEWPKDRGPVRLLIADDAADNRMLLAAFLRDVPVQVRFAVDGRQAVDAVCGGEIFDLILMDIDMPDMDGYQATAAIRDWERDRGVEETPIVALSAHAMHDAVRASLEAGCAAHVAKPVDRDTLLNAILNYARNKPSTWPAPPAVPAVESNLAAGYLAAKPAQIQQARERLATGDFDPIRRFGHNLKGTGAGYGLPHIGKIGLEIEQAAAEGDAGRIAGQLEALDRIVSEEARNRAEAPHPH